MLSPLVVFAISLFSCRDAPGEPCTVTGDGFTRTDSCRGPFQPEGKCVAWDVTCADGRSVRPDVCAGPPCTDGASCDIGWLCVKVDATDSRCLPASVCSP